MSSKPTGPPSNIVNIAPIDRREALKRVGAFAAAPILTGYHPSVPVQSGGAPWEPQFFDADEAELVAELSERIIPETETPSARAANVHQYIDLILSEEIADRQAAFRRGLARFERTGEARQIELLTEGGDFFDELKALVIDGYYKSEVGMTQELDFRGRAFVTVFDGCTHEEHLNWSPAKGEV